jgi:hypothetical protein
LSSAAAIDYARHPHFRLDNPYHKDYGEAIGRLSAAFSKDVEDKAPLLAQARQVLERYTPRGCREVFGLGAGFSLAKEFYCDVVCSNAAVVARLLEQRDEAAEAKAFLQELYADMAAAGFSRDREFFMNRLDSRTFMPMRRHIDRAYLEAIGYRHLDRVLLCVGDCQTMITAEKVRHALPLPGVDIAAYQHGLGSLTASPLGDLFHPAGYLYFVNAAADYGLFARDSGQRAARLDAMREIVAWLRPRQPRVAVFVTHVFFGVDNAMQYNGVPEANALDAVSRFSDEVAAILGEAPHARLINFQDICPFTRDRSVFRDPPESRNLLHFRFDIMERVAERVALALAPLTPIG